MTEYLAREEGKDAFDGRMLTDIVKWMGKALRILSGPDIVKRTPDKISGEYVWRMAD